MATHVEIPQPPLKPIIGNLDALDSNAPIQSLMKLAKIYGPFYKLKILSQERFVVSSQVLVNELCDETRFEKRVHPALVEIRDFAGDGLFTAYNDEPNWAKAHRILMPAFSPIGMRGMFDKMLDITDQMFLRWERFGPDAAIDVADNMTRLTLDTLALCAFDYRFNSFYQNEMHPFVGAMLGALEEAGQRTRRPDLLSNLMIAHKRKYEADQALMSKVATQLISERRRDRQGVQKNDLLNLMLHGVDSVTGEKLDDANIKFQLVTFLIAGHETTSGLLSFTTYLLLKNPAVLHKARRIVGEVLGSDAPRFEHLSHLSYVEQILKEALRLWPTAAAFAVKPLKDTFVAGKYPVTPNDTIMVLVPMLHRDPSVWGEDAEIFRPERFTPENEEKLPPNAWKPFGNGMRACIGRPFAMQEAQLVIARMLQRFDIVMDNPNYQLEIAETLTIKPRHFRIRARARNLEGMQARSFIPTTVQRSLTRATPTGVPFSTQASIPILLLYGSNTGSSEAFANRIAADAPSQGYAPTVAPLDDYVRRLPKDGVVIALSASYEGRPPDNARQFVSWIEGLEAHDLSGLKYAVFGCGNRQWASTYQAIPKRIDAGLEKASATRLRKRGEADASGDFFGAFDEWYASFWIELGAALGKEAVGTTPVSILDVEIVKVGRETTLRLHDLRQGTIVQNQELVDLGAPGARSKRHIEIELPLGMTYRSGDYLAVLARNPRPLVERTLRRFDLAQDTQLVIHQNRAASVTLPVEYPVGAFELLSNYVELAQPATRAQLTAIGAATRCIPEKKSLESLEQAYDTEVLGKRLSVLDIVDRYQSCELGFAEFLSMLPPMRSRQYSISSTPLWKENHVTLTIAVVDAPALSGYGRFHGVASTYLADLEPGARISVAVRPSNTRFRPPHDPSTPIIMACAGTGIAPFRGFLQERSIQKQGGQKVGEALLFFGVDHPEIDYLYRDELAEWEKLGIVQMLPAFSAAPEGDIKFVQHRVWQERAIVAELFRQGATVYVCGDGKRMAPAVRQTFVQIYREAVGASEEDAAAWADKVEHEHGRYVSDVFA